MKLFWHAELHDNPGPGDVFTRDMQGSITNEDRLKEMIEAAAKDFLPPKVILSKNVFFPTRTWTPWSSCELSNTNPEFLGVNTHDKFFLRIVYYAGYSYLPGTAALRIRLVLILFTTLQMLPKHD